VIYRLPPLNALRVFEAAARHLSFKAAAVELIRERAGDAELQITAPPVFAARWLMPRLAAFAKREPRIDVRVVASSKMVDAGALDSSVLMSNLDLRDESSGVEIHLGSGEYAGYRADKLFEVATTLVAAPELLATLKTPGDLANHVLIHDDAMNLVAWTAAVGRTSPRTSCRSRRPPRSSASRSRCARWWTPTSLPGGWWRRSRSSSSRNRPITLYALRLSPGVRR
jgi:DNA-binding transcriptional LysR family regulator